MSALLSVTSETEGKAPTIEGVMVSNETGEIARVNLDGKTSVTSVLPDGKRVTLFSDGRVRIEPPANPIGKKGRAKGYNQR